MPGVKTEKLEAEKWKREAGSGTWEDRRAREGDAA
jgi:hypothetical protein